MNGKHLLPAHTLLFPWNRVLARSGLDDNFLEGELVFPQELLALLQFSLPEDGGSCRDLVWLRLHRPLLTHRGWHGPGQADRLFGHVKFKGDFGKRLSCVTALNHFATMPQVLLTIAALDFGLLFPIEPLRAFTCIYEVQNHFHLTLIDLVCCSNF